jgi:hypothetical protein
LTLAKKNDVKTCTFTVKAPDKVTYNTPKNKEYEACEFTTQDAVKAAFDAWLAAAAVEADIKGGCDPKVTPSYGALPGFCGGSVKVTWTVTDLCIDPITFSADFIIKAPAKVTYNTPKNKEYEACEFTTQDAVKAAFDAWLAAAAVEADIKGGCDPKVTPSYGALPGFCGGSVKVTWTVTDLCIDPITFSADFIIKAPAKVTYNTPKNKEYEACEFTTQDAVKAAFDAWLAAAAVEADIKGGCDPKVTPSYGALPGFCGGSVKVTWTVTDLCIDPITWLKRPSLP